MAETIRINTEEYNEEFSRKLKVGDSVLITGKIYSARDAAHKVMTEALARGENYQSIGLTNSFTTLAQHLQNLVTQLVPLVLQLLVVWMLIHQQCLIKVSKA